MKMKDVIALATKDEYLRAANKLPGNRTTAEQALVDRGSNMQDVRNADFKAKEHERKHGR